MADHILEHVWLGDANDCPNFRGQRLNVMRPYQSCPVPACRSMSCLLGELPPDFEDHFVPRSNLDAIAETIDGCADAPLLVHCLGGVERAPLSTVWWMKEKKGYSLDEAYAWVKERRPIVEDRRYWVR
jgi:hypothetical protein